MSSRRSAAAAAPAITINTPASTSAPASIDAAETAAASASTSATPAPADSASISAKLHPAAVRYASTRHWLMKNEPPYSLAALRSRPSQIEPWVGVRNHEARNMMQHGMQRGHAVLYYNASVCNPHVAGVARVDSTAAYPDPTAWDRGSPYFDPKSDRRAPTWHMVDVRFDHEFVRPVYLAEMRLHCGPGGALEHASLFRRTRLSVHALTQAEFDFICGLALTPLPDAVRLKPEREGRAAQAHPSRNRRGRGGGEATASIANRKRGAATTSEEADESESTTSASSSMNANDDAVASPSDPAASSPVATPAKRRKSTRGSGSMA